MTRRWQISRSAAPEVRRWGNEYVVHHALSNDTYRMSASAGMILAELISADMSQGGSKDSTCATQGVDTEDALSALADLAFITQC
jgi:hypothetical protein